MINDALKYRIDQRQENRVFKGSLLLDAGFCVHNSLLNIDQNVFCKCCLMIEGLKSGNEPPA